VLVTIMLMGRGELAARPLDAGLAGSEPMVLSYDAQRDSSVAPATMAPSRAPFTAGPLVVGQAALLEMLLLQSTQWVGRRVSGC
jgi:hypothetical protein